MRPFLLILCLGSGAFPGAAPVAAGREPAHWAFQKPLRALPPAVQNKDWVRNPIDAFILARLEKEGLQPAPGLDRATLLRRVSFDLTGLPPTPEEMDTFLGDSRPTKEAYARVVDRLLASPHFGERWAQHYLDVVRYAESNGYEGDAERPHAFCYRDYVVRSFNEDKPYDRFITEQLAGDLLPGKTIREVQGPDRPESVLLIATGMHRCGPIHQVGGNFDPAITRQELLTEMVAGVSSAFLGLTMGCARCHDHKFDPIKLSDYYRLQAFFSTVHPKEIPIYSPEEKADYDRRMQELSPGISKLRQQVAEIDAPYRKKILEMKRAQLEPEYLRSLDTPPAKRTSEQARLAAHAEILVKINWDEIVAALTPADREKRARLRKEMHALEARKPRPLSHAWAVTDTGATPFSLVLQRGDVKKPGARVEPEVPEVLRSTVAAVRVRDKVPDESPPGLNRLDLARWMTHPEHPLTARVIVNRLWQHHFGRGLVATPNDFGLRGEAPSHPELLDWLATELVKSGWSLKHLHRLMVLSSTYQQDSRVNNPRASKVDPDNRLLWRMNRQRLGAEAIRDSILTVAGTLNRQLGGPMVRVPLEPEVYDLIFTEGEPDGLWPVTPDAKQHTRRSLYLFAKRNVRQPVLEAFDQPDTLTSCPVRPVSTFAPQALILLNGPLTQQQSQAFGVRLLRESRPDLKSRIERAYRLALARPPREEEMRQALTFLEEQSELLRDRLRARLRVNVPEGTPEGADPALAAALADFCLALFNRNEFVYVR